MPLRPGRLAAGITVALLAAGAVANASAAQAATSFDPHLTRVLSAPSA